jgi:hypothetical protein
MEERNNENTRSSVAVVLLVRIYLLLLILFDIFLVQVSCLASEGFGEESRLLTIILYVVAYLLKAKTVKPVGTAAAREGLCKYSLCYATAS